jgi:hypothetical protein
MILSDEHKKFLEGKKVMYSNFQRAGVIPHLCTADAKTFLEIAKLFDRGYIENLWCADCVMNLVDYVFKQVNVLNLLVPHFEPVKENTEDKGEIATEFPKDSPNTKRHGKGRNS